MPTKRKPKTNTKTHEDLNEILESIAGSIDSIAEKELILRDATAGLARRLEEVEAGNQAWKVTALVFSCVSLVAIIITLLK